MSPIRIGTDISYGINQSIIISFFFFFIEPIASQHT